jgi:lipoprotein NlpD
MRCTARGCAAAALVVLCAGAASAAVRTAPPAAAQRVHEVARGDTLIALARRYGVSVAGIVAANRLPGAGARLRPGQRLVIPPVSKAAESTAKPPVPAAKAPAPGAKTPPAGAAKAPLIAAKTPPAGGKTPPAAGKMPAAAAKTPPPGATPRPPSAAYASARADGLPARHVRAAVVPKGPLDLVLAVPDFFDTLLSFVWPTDGPVSSTFGRRRRGWHRGIDIMVDRGTAVTAAAPGVVVVSDVEPRYGRVVKIGHEDGFLTVYAHNDENLVAAGDEVQAGQRIANAGRTGHATSYHVHFEIRRDGRVYNPLYMLPLPPRVAQIDETDVEEDDE